MKNFNRRAITAALIITLGAAFSVNAAQTDSIENSLTEVVIAQGQQVMSDLSVQLQQSITEELNSFSIDFSLDESISESLAWLSDDQTTPVVEEAKQDEEAKSN